MRETDSTCWPADPCDDADDPDNDPRAQRLSAADALTLLSVSCGFLAVYFLTTGVLVPYIVGDLTPSGGSYRHAAATAVALMLLACVADLCDGVVARRLRSSSMGAELDNLADLISFGVAPAFFVMVWGMTTNDGHQRVAAALGVAVLLAQVLRLARFSCGSHRPGTFQGLPAPMGGLTVVSVILLQPPFLPAAVAILCIAMLMVSSVEYPKPTGRLSVAVLVWVTLSMGCLAAWTVGLPGGEALVQTGATLQVVLAVLVPVAVLTRSLNQGVRNRRSDRAASWLD